MEKKQLIAVTKKSTLAIANYTVKQKRCWALVAQKLNEYIPINKINEFWEDKDLDYLKEYVPFNHLGEFVMELNPKGVVSNRHSIMPVLESLRKQDITMSDNESHQLGFRFLSFWEIKDNKIFIGLTARCVRWVLGINRNNLFSTFHLGSFLSLSSSIAMDVYLYISGHYNMPQWKESIADLKQKFGYPKNMDNVKFLNRSLKVVKHELIEKKTLLVFDYIPIKESSIIIKKGRKGYADVEFTLYKLDNGEYAPVKKK